ncbi:MAG: fumarylacetoacetate hydrolase family protein [Henriciella sp.]|nr:fumarylacetoacetate hydrolase family protein [Henriciella sp.]
MKWVNVKWKEGTRAGLIQGENVHLTSATDVADLLADLKAAAQSAANGEQVPLKDVQIVQPVLKPRKILGIGLNYAEHAKESVSFITNAAPSVQKWFNKQATAANGPYAKVDLPSVSEQLDYEAEIVAIIGKTGRHVPADRAWELIAGLCCGCDFSVRDWQRASQTMIMGKGFDTHAPFGPFLVTPDEIDDFGAVEVRGYVNGELRQSGHARDMTFSISEQIAHLTAAFTLEPGDVIFTGTPAGVGAGFDPPKWLKAGDRVRVEVSGLGHMENEIVAEKKVTVLN